MMNFRVLPIVGAAAISLAGGPSVNPAYAKSAPPTTSAVATASDGQRGFDFLFGSWTTRYKRLRHPLSGSHEWYACDGTSIVRPLMAGAANIEDGDIRCPSEDIHAITLRMYDAHTRQWSLYWGTEKQGLPMPPQVGRFDANGVGVFLSDGTYAGKAIIVRYQWTASTDDHPHFEQAFSSDGGKTWETNWICDYTRAAPVASTEK